MNDTYMIHAHDDSFLPVFVFHSIGTFPQVWHTRFDSPNWTEQASQSTQRNNTWYTHHARTQQHRHARTQPLIPHIIHHISYIIHHTSLYIMHHTSYSTAYIIYHTSYTSYSIHHTSYIHTHTHIYYNIKRGLITWRKFSFHWVWVRFPYRHSTQ